ncbi:hypothetical protein O9G_000987 [Rozella allomycis CSF55]|uniref:Uncharacterized protein n=1 Tax=Rozella allomycis (strain CSF55) TaxID=988480 RepID=A0A075ANE0_ROZAC|nr:hypothetical protein O9G_000987 [Rozella allomycis CSF55]|eukprot:EPZ31342.1 hypothetical protein O9G_000987 [Rozella allomycis CSF55]
MRYDYYGFKLSVHIFVLGLEFTIIILRIQNVEAGLNVFLLVSLGAIKGIKQYSKFRRIAKEYRY